MVVVLVLVVASVVVFGKPTTAIVLPRVPLVTSFIATKILGLVAAMASHGMDSAGESAAGSSALINVEESALPESLLEGSQLPEPSLLEESQLPEPNILEESPLPEPTAPSPFSELSYLDESQLPELCPSPVPTKRLKAEQDNDSRTPTITFTPQGSRVFDGLSSEAGSPAAGSPAAPVEDDDSTEDEVDTSEAEWIEKTRFEPNGPSFYYVKYVQERHARKLASRQLHATNTAMAKHLPPGWRNRIAHSVMKQLMKAQRPHERAFVPSPDSPANPNREQVHPPHSDDSSHAHMQVNPQQQVDPQQHIIPHQRPVCEDME